MFEKLNVELKKFKRNLFIKIITLTTVKLLNFSARNGLVVNKTIKKFRTLWVFFIGDSHSACTYIYRNALG